MIINLRADLMRREGNSMRREGKRKRKRKRKRKGHIY
jgi:hypothetical protein